MKKLRIISLLLVAAMFCAVVTACGSKNESTNTTTSTAASESTGADTETSTPAEPTEISIVVTRHPNDKSKSFDEKQFVAKAEEATNIHVNWVELVEGQDGERLATILAGNDMPDAFMIGYNMPDTIIIQNTSLFLPLNDLFETYAPNTYKLYEENIPDWREFLTYPDGNIYGLMSGALNSKQHMSQNIQWINTKWLDNLGLSMPTTLDEFYNVLVAFRDKDANGNGDTKDEIPLEFTQSNIMYYSYMWGLPLNRGTFHMVKDGKVQGAIDTKAFREYLEFFHKLFKEGLIDNEGFTLTGEQANANIDAMKCGIFDAWAPYSVIQDKDKKLEYDSMTPITAPGYTPYIISQPKNMSNRNGFVISASSKNAEACFRYWDCIQGTEEMARLTYRGPEGMMYKVEDGKMIAKMPTPEEIKEYGYPELADTTNDSILGNTVGYNNHYPLLLDLLNADMSDPTANITVRILGVEKQKPYFAEPTTQRIATAEKWEELDFATQGLKDVVAEYLASAIMNGVTDENWNKFLQDIDRCGYKTYVQWYSDYQDGKF